MTTTLASPAEAPSPAKAKSFEAWKLEGEDLFVGLQEKEDAYETSQWNVGDWLLTGEETLKFGLKAYSAAEQITGWTRETLYNVVSVVRRFKDPSLRSETVLRWSHFKELARIKDEKKRIAVLEKLNDGFPKTVLQVREAVDKAMDKPVKQGHSGPKTFKVQTSLKQEQRNIFKAIAKSRRKNPEDLLRSIVLKFIAEHKDEVKSKALKR